ncbi:MAG: hypothetical protein CVU07_01535 [Bacteroidetes bacterium HGW-Bacteroidetes-23]|nr:MAG: hypothetical protein CVU07_01535 [Bacteroidetes bacterium HGW-Bacteroidetes-23]
MSINFSDENISEFRQKSNTLEEILLKNGLGLYVDYLSKIRIAAENKNELEFKEIVISRELFGGSGALWEIHIENPIEYQNFNKHFSEYVKFFIQMGIRNGRVKQIQETINKLS